MGLEIKIFIFSEIFIFPDFFRKTFFPGFFRNFLTGVNHVLFKSGQGLVKTRKLAQNLEKKLGNQHNTSNESRKRALKTLKN